MVRPGAVAGQPPDVPGRRAFLRTRRLLLTGAIFALAFIVRLVPLGFYVTPDEPIWVLRSIRFLDALSTGDMQAMPQTGHPGITTMALGALGTWITTRLAPITAAGHLAWLRPMLWLAPENAAAFRHLAFFLPAGRGLVALVTSLGLALIYPLGHRRLGPRPARLVALLLALDPFFSGYAGLLHTDALQATFVLLAVLLALPRARHRRNWVSWIGSGLCLALAGLTKILGLLVAPGLALAILLWDEPPFKRRVLKVGVIAAAAFVGLFALYPPFWVNPVGAVRSLLDAVSYHEGIGLRSVFFLGQSRVDPGPLFYPVVLLFRLTPPVLIGLVLWGLRVRRDGLRLRRSLLLLLPALVYFVAITVASKKFDRYVLTVVPLLTVVAVCTWHRSRWMRRGVLLTLVLPWVVTALIPLQYASPLLGGPWTARHLVPLGWSEGSGFAARRLNLQSSLPESSSVMTHNVPGTASIFEGEVWPWKAQQQRCVDAVLGSDGVDSEPFVFDDRLVVSGLVQAITYIHPPTALPETRLLVPGPLPGISQAATAPVTGTTQLADWLDAYLAVNEPFIWVHASSCYPLTESQLGTLLDSLLDSGGITCVSTDSVFGFAADRCFSSASRAEGAAYLARFGGALDLLAVDMDPAGQAPDSLAVRLRWQPWAHLGDLDIYLALVTESEGEQIAWAEGGRQMVDATGRPVSAWQPGHLFDGEGYIPLPLDLPPGTYPVVMQISGTGGWLGFDYPEGSFGGIQLPLGSVRIDPPPYPAPELDLSTTADVAWPGIQVVGVRGLAGGVWAGQPLRFSLGLGRTAGSTPSSLVWELTCEGAQRDGGTLVWPASDPATWRGGHRYVVHFAPRLHPRTAPGACQLWVGPASGAALRPSQASEGILLGQVQVLQRERIYELPHRPDFGLDIAVGDFAYLRGTDVSASVGAPGQPVTVTLYWQATGPALRDYTVFVHLIGPDGQVRGQLDRPPADGDAPTSTWLSDEVVVDVHPLSPQAVAPTGRYRLYAGLYDPRTGIRVPLYERGELLPDARALVGEIELRR